MGIHVLNPDIKLSPTLISVINHPKENIIEFNSSLSSIRKSTRYNTHTKSSRPRIKE